MNGEDFFELVANSEHRPEVIIQGNACDRESALMARQALAVNNMSIALHDFFNVMRNAWKYDTLPEELTAPEVEDIEKEGFKLAAYYIRPIFHRCLEEAGAQAFGEDLI
jgi:hypothetical protein